MGHVQSGRKTARDNPSILVFVAVNPGLASDVLM